MPSQQIYQMARARGLNKPDGASVVTLYEEMAGVRLGPREAEAPQFSRKDGFHGHAARDEEARRRRASHGQTLRQ